MADVRELEGRVADAAAAALQEDRGGEWIAVVDGEDVVLEARPGDGHGTLEADDGDEAVTYAVRITVSLTEVSRRPA